MVRFKIGKYSLKEVKEDLRKHYENLQKKIGSLIFVNIIRKRSRKLLYSPNLNLRSLNFNLNQP